MSHQSTRNLTLLSIACQTSPPFPRGVTFLFSLDAHQDIVLFQEFRVLQKKKKGPLGPSNWNTILDVGKFPSEKCSIDTFVFPEQMGEGGQMGRRSMT